MSHTSKSPVKVALTALAVAKRALRPYAHRFSPKKFTQHQLFACLVLKGFFHTDYRGIAEILRDLPSLREVLGMEVVPHFTTFQKAAQRLLGKAPANRLLEQTIEQCLRRGQALWPVRLAALDSSGFEAHRVSRYFIERRAKGLNGPLATKFKSYPKLSVLCDCASHVILAAEPDRSPRSDLRHFEPTLRRAHARTGLRTLLADAAYDAEWVHQMARTELGVRTIIPPTRGRPTDKPLAGRYRRLMQQTIHLTPYGQRWQVETVMSMIKRRLGSALGACSHWAQCRALMLKAVAHNILILLRHRGFLQSTKFEIASHCSVKATLSGMGVNAAFGSQSADFDRMIIKKFEAFRVYLSEVYHDAWTEVNEEGTEAAAATTSVHYSFGCSAAPVSPPRADFHADHPFLFLIVHNESRSILFAGWITNPGEIANPVRPPDK